MICPSIYPGSYLNIAATALEGSYKHLGWMVELPGELQLCSERPHWHPKLGVGARQASTCTCSCQNRRLKAEMSIPGSLCRRGGGTDGRKPHGRAAESHSCCCCAVALLGSHFVLGFQSKQCSFTGADVEFVCVQVHLCVCTALIHLL